MLPFGVTIPATVLQRSELPEGLMIYPVSSYKVCVIVQSPQLADLWLINGASDGPNHYLGVGYQQHINFIPSPDDKAQPDFETL